MLSAYITGKSIKDTKVVETLCISSRCSVNIDVRRFANNMRGEVSIFLRMYTRLRLPHNGQIRPMYRA